MRLLETMTFDDHGLLFIEKAGALSCALQRLPSVHVAPSNPPAAQTNVGRVSAFFRAVKSGSGQTPAERPIRARSFMHSAMIFGRLSGAALNIADAPQSIEALATIISGGGGNDQTPPIRMDGLAARVLHAGL